MKITDLRELSVPLVGNVANSLVNFSEHTVSMVAIVTDVVRNGKPVVGFGFNSIGRFAQGGIMRERLFPRLDRAGSDMLLAKTGDQFDLNKVYSVLVANEKPGGHGDRATAIGGLELAFWDLNAKLNDEPAWRTISRHFDRTPECAGAPVYAAGGYYTSNGSVEALADEIRSYRDAGFEKFKIKIGGAPLLLDLKRIEAAIEVAGSGSNLSVDANGRFDKTTAIEYARALDAYGLRWYEEAGDPLDFELNQHVASNYQGAIATGENLFSSQDVRNLIIYGGMRPGKDIFQMDPGLSYGLTEFNNLIGLMEANGFSRAYSYPHGGHLINLHAVVGLELGGCEAYPAVFQPFGGYPAGCIRDGRVHPTDAPGFGLEQKAELRPVLEKILEA
ncbi:MAG: mandelate racemase [Rhizobiaceae bacterium]|nr:mandelate racemase [Rhizobiaceae bacterium]